MSKDTTEATNSSDSNLIWKDWICVHTQPKNIRSGKISDLSHFSLVVLTYSSFGFNIAGCNIETLVKGFLICFRFIKFHSGAFHLNSEVGISELQVVNFNWHTPQCQHSDYLRNLCNPDHRTQAVVIYCLLALVYYLYFIKSAINWVLSHSYLWTRYYSVWYAQNAMQCIVINWHS